jgi:hypothetical protein
MMYIIIDTNIPSDDNRIKSIHTTLQKAQEAVIAYGKDAACEILDYEVDVLNEDNNTLHRYLKRI